VKTLLQCKQLVDCVYVVIACLFRTKLHDIDIIAGDCVYVVIACLFRTKLHDIDIIAGDGVTFSCHKCILDARLQYFHGLLSSTWIEVVYTVRISLIISAFLCCCIMNSVSQKKSSLKFSGIFSPNGWEFFVHILHTYYTLLSTLDYKFLFNYLQL